LVFDTAIEPSMSGADHASRRPWPVGGLARSRAPAEIARDAGIPTVELTAARDAWLRRHATPRDQRLTAALTAAVEIRRDRAGVPHIYATNTNDLYFGLGVATAQDRLWQMDRLRRRALGRQAEVLGPPMPLATSRTSPSGSI